MRRLLGFNLLTAVVLGIVGFYVGWCSGTRSTGRASTTSPTPGQNDIALFVGYLVGVRRLPRRPRLPQLPDLAHARQAAVAAGEGDRGIGRYLGLCTDHKVVGIQYLLGIGVFIFIGGLNAMLIRFELMRPTHLVWNGNNYLTLVGVHGTMMMGMMTSGILGPFANYFVPILIGARRMAFPRIEALTFWLLMAAGTILMTTFAFGGFPTGWTGYAPLSEQANMGMDAYIAFFALVGLSMTLLGLNMMATIITMRAPGMTWGRLPLFVWGTFSTAVLMVLAAPVLISTLSMLALDRTAQTGFFNDHLRRQPVPLREPLLDLRAPRGLHPRPPGLGDPARDPAGLRAQAGLGLPPRRHRDARRLAMSFLVWQHHLFVSGINADLRPFYMLSTEIISLPTGFIFICALGTLWRGRIRCTVPMLFALALDLQLPDRRALRRLPLGHPERRDDARQLLLDGPLPLHDHGRADLRLLRRRLLLAAEDDRVQPQRAASARSTSG